MAITIHSVINALKSQPGCVWDFNDWKTNSCRGSVTDEATSNRYNCTLNRIREGNRVMYDLEVQGITAWRITHGEDTTEIVAQLVDLIARDAIRNAVHNFLIADTFLPEAVRVHKEPTFTHALSPEALQGAIAAAINSTACDAQTKALLVEVLNGHVFDLDGYETKVMLEEADDVPIVVIQLPQNKVAVPEVPDTTHYAESSVEEMEDQACADVEAHGNAVRKISRKAIKGVWAPIIHNLVHAALLDSLLATGDCQTLDLHSVVDRSNLELTKKAVAELQCEQLSYSFLHDGKLVTGDCQMGDLVVVEDVHAVDYRTDGPTGVLRARYLKDGSTLSLRLIDAIHYTIERHIESELVNNSWCADFAFAEALNTCGVQMTDKAGQLLCAINADLDDFEGLLCIDQEAIKYTYRFEYTEEGAQVKFSGLYAAE